MRRISMKRIYENKLQKYEKDHLEKIRKHASECTLFLKKDTSFPIKKGKIAAYGNGVRYTIKGGTGSGDVNVRQMVNVEEGLKNAGFEITTEEWLEKYDQVIASAKEKYYEEIKKTAKDIGCSPVFLAMGKAVPEPAYEIPLNGKCDTAIYVLARISGEGNDRSAGEGDIALTQTEVRDILALNEKYSRFMLVLNTGGLVDLSPVKDVKNILLLGQLGASTGDILADILTGNSYPSGKLTMTWTKLSDYPSTDGFGDKNDTLYKEGIFVGYRYFDTEQKDVLYPFGYGLGYTEFEIKDFKMQIEEDYNIRINTIVKNTGKYRGKETVQVYISAPSNKLERPFQELAAFGKTKELNMGEQEELTLLLHLSDIAGYDEESGTYLLESGEYTLRIGNSSRDTKILDKIVLDNEIIIDRNLKKKAGDTAQEEDIQKKLCTLNARQLAELCVGDFTDKEEESIIGAAASSVAGGAGETTNRLKKQGIQRSITMADGPAGIRISTSYKIIDGKIKSTASPFGEEMLQLFSQEELCIMEKMNQMTEKEKNTVEYYQYCSAIPIGTDLAQSFNCSLASIMGDIVAEEMQLFGVNLWLAPAMNIQRNPLCGRNFEYFSEDPFLSGKMGAAITRGVQRHKNCGVTVKHFACNNQETNRLASNSVLSERTLREIYLKPFEICIKESQPCALMSSYNLINGEHVCNRRDLIDGILREQWGFDGIVMTDWLVTTDTMLDPESKYSYASAAGCVKAGNDLIMPGKESDVQDILKALEEESHPYHLTRENLEKCAARILRMIEKFTGTWEQEKGER